MMPSLKQRRRDDELMDQPGLDPGEHHRALAGLARTNLFGTTRRQLWKEIATLARRCGRERLRGLDVGSGAGDLAIWLARKAADNGLELQMDGCDVSNLAVEHSTRAACEVGCEGVRFFRCDILSETPEEEYDIVVSTLFLHHLEEEHAVRLLEKMASLARLGILVDDLCRTMAGYLLAWWGPRLLTRSRIVHVDGPLSVRAAFTVEEALALAKQAGLEGSTAESMAKKVTANMQGPDVLDVAHFPTAEFSITSTRRREQPSERGLPVYDFRGVFTLHGQSRKIQFPVEVEVRNGWNRIMGRFSILQTDYGMTPYSTAFGAIGVADQLTIFGDLWVAPDPSAL